jgi:hypothetical protein
MDAILNTLGNYHSILTLQNLGAAVNYCGIKKNLCQLLTGQIRNYFCSQQPYPA